MSRGIRASASGNRRRAAADIEDPTEQRAIQEIVALGEAAVPVLVGDLLLHRQPQPRELGIELLGYVGAPALPKLLAIAGHHVGEDGVFVALKGRRPAAELEQVPDTWDYSVQELSVPGLEAGSRHVVLMEHH